MSKEKEQPRPETKKADVKTPTPPQDMNPSKTPPAGEKVLGDEDKKNRDSKKK